MDTTTDRHSVSSDSNSDFNNLVSLDGQLGFGQYGHLSGFAAQSHTPGFKTDQHAFNLGARYDSESWLISLDYTEVATNFNPEMGFLQRSAYRRPSYTIFYRYRPEDFIGILEMRPHVVYRGYWGFDDFQETGYLHVDNHWQWRNGYELHTGINFTKEGVREPFEITEGVIVPESAFNHREADLVFWTDQSEWISFSERARIGGFFGGRRFSINSMLNLRIEEVLNTQFSFQYNNVRLPAGDFTSNLFQARISFAFTPRIYLQTLIQYNQEEDLWSVNLRFSWLQAANTGLFIVFNQTNESNIHGIPVGIQNHNLIVKYSYLFDVI